MMLKKQSINYFQHLKLQNMENLKKYIKVHIIKFRRHPKEYFIFTYLFL